jgi:hypothetical protein
MYEYPSGAALKPSFSIAKLDPIWSNDLRLPQRLIPYRKASYN